MSETLKGFFRAQARGGGGKFAIACAIVVLAETRRGAATEASPSAHGGLDQDFAAHEMKLGMLHDHGVLTEEEFQEQKNRILGKAA